MSNSRKEFTAVEVENCVPERERVHQALIDLIEHDKKYDLVFDILLSLTPIHPKTALTPYKPIVAF